MSSTTTTWTTDSNTKASSSLSTTVTDVKIAATDTACVSGVLRVYAILADISSQQTGRTVADRDLLA